MNDGGGGLPDWGIPKGDGDSANQLEFHKKLFFIIVFPHIIILCLGLFLNLFFKVVLGAGLGLFLKLFSGVVFQGCFLFYFLAVSKVVIENCFRVSFASGFGA